MYMGRGVGKGLNLDEPNALVATKKELSIIMINTRSASTTP
jgi:hypothetical protein